MKRFLCFFLVACLSFAVLPAKSQIVRFTSDSTGAYYDTTSGSTTESQKAVFNGTGKTIGVQVMLTRLSGTAAGVLRLLASNDGTNYTLTGDSADVTNVASQAFLLKTYTPLPWLYLKVRYEGTGTMSVKWETRAMYRRE